MNKTRQSQKSTDADGGKDATMLLLLTLVDTTWRLFVPTIGGTVLGLVADNQFNSAPLWTIVGVSTGTIAAIMLVYAQLKKVKKGQ